MNGLYKESSAQGEFITNTSVNPIENKINHLKHTSVQRTLSPHTVGGWF